MIFFVGITGVGLALAAGPCAGELRFPFKFMRGTNPLYFLVAGERA